METTMDHRNASTQVLPLKNKLLSSLSKFIPKQKQGECKIGLSLKDTWDITMLSVNFRRFIFLVGKYYPIKFPGKQKVALPFIARMHRQES